MDRIGETISGYTITRCISADQRTVLYHVERGAESAQLRMLLPELSRNQRTAARFLRSMEALQRASHAGVVQILGTGTLKDGCAYAILQPITGAPLSEVPDQERRTAARPLLQQLASALAALHRQGVAYLGLQPERILLGTSDGALRAQLLDTETTRAAGETSPAPTIGDSQVGGSSDPILYMAPEYFNGRGDLGPPADVYALGALAYLLLGGRPPCTGARTGEVIANHLRQVPRPLRELAPDVPAELAGVIDAMLAKDPDQRPDMARVEQALSPPAPPPTEPVQATRPQAEPEGPLRFGDYEVVRLIGEGGQGQVYEAFSARQQRRAAIKVMRPEISRDPQHAADFLNEVRTANLVNHPGIITILQADQAQDGRLYTVMEYLDGDTLRDRIGRGPMPAHAVARLSWHMALALAAAHERGVIHRDLKPANVIVIEDRTAAGGERTKILDFGIAKLVRLRPGQAGPPVPTLVGTPAYMPPEQLQDAGGVDDRADVYALGVMMYEMLQGGLPEGRPPLGASCPPRLSQLIQRMLAPERTQRPSMKVVVAELERLDSEETPAPPPPPPPPPNRRPLLFGLGGVAAAALVGVGLWAALKRSPPPPPPGGGRDLGTEVAGPITQADMARAAEEETPPPRGMVAIAGGEFSLGSGRNPDDPIKPARVRRFALDIDEVTNADFAAWLNSISATGGLALSVEQGRLVRQGSALLLGLDPQSGGITYQGRKFAARPGAEKRPVALVTYQGADLYCGDHDKRLPRENEWEVAARGPDLKRRYPWGDNAPACAGVVFGRVPEGVCAAEGAGPGVVGSQAGGARTDRIPEGAYDLGGNLAEWVQSGGLPAGEEGAKAALRVLRGGDWFRPAEACQVRSRLVVNGEEPRPNVGFRCAKDMGKNR